MRNIVKYVGLGILKMIKVITMNKALLSACMLLFAPFLKAERPNILLIVSDDLNANIGPYMGIAQHTPNLDRLAQDGVVFTRAYSQYPVCGPSRASFMSGLYPETCGVVRNSTRLGSYKVETPALSDHPSMAGFFRERGYFTARVSKIFHMGVPGDIENGTAGSDEPESWDYAYNVLAPETLSQGELVLLSPKHLQYGGNFSMMAIPDELDFTQADYLATSQAIAIMENRVGKIPEGATNRLRQKKDDPFFLAVGFVRPHVPFVAPERSFAPYPPQEMGIPEVVVGENVPDQALARQNDRIFGMNELQKQQTISAYMASVRFMDEQVGRLLDAIDQLGIREETIVIFLSDHGYNLGEHDCWSKISLWEGSIRAPLIISAPGADYEENHHTESAAIVELIDLYPTIAELLGMHEELPAILQGQSLVPQIKDSSKPTDKNYAYSITNHGNDGSIRTERWRYTRWSASTEPGYEELYDHENDPEEHVNLADDPDKTSILLEMRKKYDAVHKKANGGLSDYIKNQ